jgi:hypothetical protein
MYLHFVLLISNKYVAGQILYGNSGRDATLSENVCVFCNKTEINGTVIRHTFDISAVSVQKKFSDKRN